MTLPTYTCMSTRTKESIELYYARMQSAKAKQDSLGSQRVLKCNSSRVFAFEIQKSGVGMKPQVLPQKVTQQPPQVNDFLNNLVSKILANAKTTDKGMKSDHFRYQFKMPAAVI